LIGSGALAVFGSAFARASNAAEDRFARFFGQSVSFCVPDHPHYDAMLRLLPQFTAETGIKVNVARENILRMKHVQMAGMAKPQSEFDLVTYIVTWKSEFVKKNLLLPLCAKHRSGGWPQGLFAGSGGPPLRFAVWRRNLGAGLPPRCF
jgi:multiple sugar transport system substrate-binding protein